MLKLHAINPFSQKTIPIFLKSDDDFGHLNENGEPYVDSKLGYYPFRIFGLFIFNQFIS